MYTIAERIAVVSYRLCGMTYDEARDNFTRKFHKPAPTRHAIKKMVNKFKRTGSVTDEQRTGRPAVADETVERIQEAITRSPSASTRRISRELGIAHTTVWKTLRFKLRKHAYHIQIVHKLEDEDYAARQAMCYDLLDAVRNENLMQHVLFSDEATFHTCGHVNRHNCRIWADEQPNAVQQWERDSPKVNVWMGITKSKLYGPFMFAERTVTGITYLDLLQQFLEPQVIQDGILDSVVFQQDGAPPHFATIVRDYLNDTFPERWIGRASPRLWAPRSPDLTPMDFFVWGFIKSKVYQVKINGLQQLKNRIYAAAEQITPDLLARVFRATEERWDMCLDLQGHHVEMY